MDRIKTRRLIEASLMVALSTVLGVFKLVEMPYGGSVTFASMLPIVILSYRHGVGTGLVGGAVSAVIQQLLGLKYLSYFTTWQSVVALVLLDYIIAFTVVGLGGIWRRAVRRQSTALVLGSVTVGVLRYVCHVISGATVWVGLSIPDSAALIYSIGYNATYMLPETMVLALVAYYIGEHIDLLSEVPRRRAPESGSPTTPYLALSVLLLVAGAVADIAVIAPSLQDADTGMFVISGMSSAPWLTVGIVSAVCVAAAVVFLILGMRERASKK